MVFGLKQYNSLHLHQKAILLESEAVFIDHHFTEIYTYTLFSYNGYFIEVTIESATNNLVTIIAFKKGKKLDKYLSEVSLNELLD